MYRAFLKT